MRLIEKDDGLWYFCIDVFAVPFAESIDYDTQQDAALAALYNTIQWESCSENILGLLEKQIKNTTEHLDTLQKLYKKQTGVHHVFFK